MSSSALTTENSAVVMIDHAVGFGTVFRSHDLALHVLRSEAQIIEPPNTQRFFGNPEEIRVKPIGLDRRLRLVRRDVTALNKDLLS